MASDSLRDNKGISFYAAKQVIVRVLSDSKQLSRCNHWQCHLHAMMKQESHTTKRDD